MNHRLLTPVGALVAVAMVAVAGAALVDRSPRETAAVAGFGAGPVGAADARSDTWRAVADLVPRLDPASSNACERGEPSCLAAVLDEMAVRLEALGCDHRAPFAFTYLEMTRGVHERVREPGFFDDPPVTVHADALFARLYFEAFDNWEAGRLDEVPAAWRVAFGASASGRTPAGVDLFLGMNAHIARDLPYVVAEVAGWQAEAAADRSGPGAVSTDFGRINEVIDEVRSPMLEGAAIRFDPFLLALDQPLPAVAGAESTELIGQWRDQALERGLRLAAASTDAERRAVEAEIERGALATAVLLLNAGTLGPAPLTPAERDAHCEENRP